MRVVFVVLDGMPARHVGPEVTPRLWALAGEGARFAVGRSVMTSATYPNHATFSTGAGPAVHGLWANWVQTDGGPLSADRVGPAVATLFDACRAGGRSSGAVFGDNHLVGVMGAGAADECWPADGRVPEGVSRDAHDYIADHEVVPRAVAAVERGFDLTVLHLNEPDTFAHVHGPDSDDARAGYRATDACLGEIVDAVDPADTVVLVVSDHDLEPVTPDAVDLYGPVAEHGLPLVPIPEGTAAMVWGDDPLGGAWLDGIDGIEGHREVAAGVRLVWGKTGRQFALPPGFPASTDKGQHGGMRTREQVAVVAGDDPAVDAIARTLASRTPAAKDWAVTIADLLEIALPDATGRALLS